MATTKSTTLTFRIEPGLKAALRAAAAREHRSVANMVEVLILDYCQRQGIDTSQTRVGHTEKASRKGWARSR